MAENETLGEEITDVINDVIAEGERIFPPKPGGMVERHRARKAEEEKRRAAENPEVAEDGYTAIRVRSESPDIVNAYMVILNAGAPQVLPRDIGRQRAVILAVDQDIWLSHSQGTASGFANSATALGSAFYLPVGVPIPCDSTGQLFGVPTNTGASCRVSVLVTRNVKK